MRLAILGSGSGGNAVIIEAAGRRLLIDAGFSCREIERRLGALGVDARSLETLVLTHEHHDHVHGADRLVSRHGLELYATAGTLAGSPLGAQARTAARTIRSGVPFETRDGGFVIEPFQLPHDAREPVGFVVEDAAGHRVGLVADLGSRTQLAWAKLRNLDVLIVETNHDLQMLRQGPYPWHLKQRVAGRHGHLSNHEAADGLPELVCERLRWVALYHLSQTNNLPALALHTVGERLATVGCSAQLVVCRQHEPSRWIEIEDV